jgi:hypothetical protein
MWMSGPEWGWLSIDGRDEIHGATPDDVVWSADGDFLAFVRLHVQDVPNRQGAEGMNYKVGIVRLADYSVRYCLGNHGLADVKVHSLSSRSLAATINGEPRTVQLDKLNWNSPVEL